MTEKVEHIEKSVQLNQGFLSSDGALLVKTGDYTGRSPKERFIVRYPEIENQIDWSGINKGISPEWAEGFFDKLIDLFPDKPNEASKNNKEVNKQKTYSTKSYVGCFGIEVNSTSPWHIAFAQNMFREDFIPSLKKQVPDDVNIKIFHAPDMKVSQLGVKHEHESAVIVDIVGLRVGIVGTAYAGEIKKSAFSICNFLFPKYGILPMHSSANAMKEGKNSSILFGLSGTGKTTLSADPHRLLIGDDEIIWSETGISNLEGGCYAKLIGLSSEKEPDIFSAVNQFGSILENVIFNSETREIDFSNGDITENTRASYSLDALDSVFQQNKEAEIPRSIIFLTADAFGALPAVSRLDRWQTQYHFISGYTAKVAGTEIGVVEPQATFSSCFGAPFMPRSALVYGELLSRLIEKHNVPVWLLNTGWTGGGYSEGGSRFPISVSRQLLTLIQSGDLNRTKTIKHPVFGFEVPTEAKGIDKKYLLIPEGSKVLDLARKFQENAKICFSKDVEEVIQRGGPQIPK